MPQEQDSGKGPVVRRKTTACMLLALGSNLTSLAGGPAKTLDAATKSLSQSGAVIRAVSRYYHTPAFPEGNGPDFVNAALRIEADWSPAQALEILHDIENELGRLREVRWGERTIDIDLIAYGDCILPNAATQKRWRTLSLEAQMRETPAELILPHPRLQDRAFVLVPLADVAADWEHPLLGLSVGQMLQDLPQTDLDAVRLAE